MTFIAREEIEWKAADVELPGDEIIVLVCAPSVDEPVWVGWHADGCWVTAEGIEYDQGAVTAWAHLPIGPPTEGAPTEIDRRLQRQNDAGVE